MVERGPFGLPALPAKRKLFLTVAMSVLGILTLIRLLVEVVTGSSDWPYYLLGIVAVTVMIFMVRRTPTKRKI
jgi:bacteriorhodopsin